jgi:hypothetical protein
MKPPRNLFRFPRAAVLALLVLIAPASRADSILIEAEGLENLGGWQMSRDTKVVREFLITDLKGHVAPAVGAVQLPRAGQWRLWVRSKDYPQDRPGIRNYTVRLGAQRSAVVFGKHGREGMGGWDWEDYNNNNNNNNNI